VTEAKTARQHGERLALLAHLYGPEKVRRDSIRYELVDLHREAAKWQAGVDKARGEAARLRGDQGWILNRHC
jgi:hypothetical protein